MKPGGTRAALAAWCLYDWALSAFSAVVVTFVFATYFTELVAPTPEQGTALWGWAMGVSGVAVAIVAPVAGAIADRAGRRLPWLLALTAVAAAVISALWLVEPDPDFVVLGLVLIAFANLATELAAAFYNALLPGLAPPGRLGRLSGWGWGLGYAGGLAALAIVLLLFVWPETPAFGLDKAAAEHVRAAAPLTALWLLIFSAPLFLLLREPPAPPMGAVKATREGLALLARTLRTLRGQPTILRFLIARMLYTDGLNTLFAFGGIYAAGSFGLDFEQVLLLGILLNVTGGIGAALGGSIDDRIGAKPTIAISLVALTAIGVGLLLIEGKAAFWTLALLLGLFVGPTQAASRSLMARLSPPEIVGEMFGLYALSGKITAFLGPTALAIATTTFASQRAGMATIVVLLSVGLAVLVSLKINDENDARR